MGTTTTRVGLYKPLSDGSELVNVATDLDANYDLIDLSVGYQACTSSTRPSSPYSGKPIMETNTNYRSYFSNGTTPASASWVEIPNSSGTFGGNIKIASGNQVNVGGSGSNASYVSLLPTATGDYILASRVTGDSVSRLTVRADGRLDWSTGALAVDTNLYRSAADTLKTDDSFITVGNVTVGGNLTVNGIGQTQYIAKTADQTVTNSATLVNDTHLVLPVAANATYTFELDLYTTELTDFLGDFKMSFACPTGALFDMHGEGAHQTDLAVGTNSNGEWIGKLATASGAAVLSYGVGTSLTAIRIHGRLVMSTTAGNFQMQWAQNAADASGTILKAGSFMTLTRVA